MKGSILWTTRSVVVIVASSLILMIAINTTDSVNGKIRVESIDMVEDRVRAAIYATAGLEEGSTQINFKDEYNLTMENGEPYLKYEWAAFSLSILSNRGEEKITSPVDFVVEEGVDESLCIVKEKNAKEVLVKAGECSL